MASDWWQGPKNIPIQATVFAIPSLSGTYKTITVDVSNTESSSLKEQEQCFINIVEKYDIKDILVSIYTDGAPNIKTAGFTFINCCRYPVFIGQIRCTAHIFNLFIEYVYELLEIADYHKRREFAMKKLSKFSNDCWTLFSL